MKIISEISANVLKCDIPNCPARFSYSEHAVIRKQAKIEHWGRRGARRLGAEPEVADLCPDHDAEVRAKAKEDRAAAKEAAKKAREAAREEKKRTQGSKPPRRRKKT